MSILLSAHAVNCISTAPSEATLNWASDGDTNGLFYYLGTNQLTTGFNNPANGSFMTTTSTGFVAPYTHNNLFDRNSSSYYFVTTGTMSIIDITLTGNFKMNRISLRAGPSHDFTYCPGIALAVDMPFEYNELYFEPTGAAGDWWTSPEFTLTDYHQYYGLYIYKTGVKAIAEMEIYGHYLA